MINIQFSSIDEFEQLFSYKNEKIANAVYEAIKESYSINKKSAHLFHIEFMNQDIAYDVNMPKNQWHGALAEVLKFYESISNTDRCIDTWQLLEAVKYDKPEDEDPPLLHSS